MSAAAVKAAPGWTRAVATAVVVSLDEHTSCVVDAIAGTVDVRGQGTMTVLRGRQESIVPAGERAAIDLLRPGP